MKTALFGLVALVLTTRPAVAGSVTVVTSQQYYEIGALVEYTFTNGLDETIWMNGFPYWWILRVDTQTLVFPCVGLPVFSPLGPGQSETYNWDQIVCSTGQQAAPGLYWVGLTYWTDSDPTLIDVRAPFCVGSDCGPTAADELRRVGSWGGVKSLYR